MIEEKELEDEKLIETITELRGDRVRLAEMAQASRSCGPDKATGIICDTILEDYRNE